MHRDDNDRVLAVCSGTTKVRVIESAKRTRLWVGSHFVRGKKRERYSWNKTERNGGGMEWSMVWQWDVVSSHWTAESDASRRVSSREDSRFIARIFADLRYRLSSSNNRLLAFAGNERIEDTYVQVCLSRAIPLTSISAICMPTTTHVVRWASKNLSSGSKSYEPTIFSK